MKKRLEFKILAVVGSMLIVGIAIAGIMSVAIQKATLYSVAEYGTEKTADIIFRNLETTMVEGRKDIAKKLIEDMGRSRGIENITVFDAEGRPAFNKDSPVQEADAMQKLKSGRDRLMLREKSRIIYYLPLKNIPSCHACHGSDKDLLGAVKISVTIEKEYKKAMALITIVIVITIIASLCFSLLLWILLRKMVIAPVKSIEAASARIASGDLAFEVQIAGDDEIGRLSTLLKESFLSLEVVLQRIKELSDRILKVVAAVDLETEKVRKGAEAETAATGSIALSVEELNATATGIAANTDELAFSAEDASASIEQMVSSIRQINENIHHLDRTVEASSSSIDELSASLREVADSSEKLSADSEETVTAISEIAASIREVEAHAKESALLSEKVTSDAATLGMDSIARTIDGMKEIETSVQNTALCIGALGKRSTEIWKILRVIQSVNDETYLLSLNATILASQAGEHGKGFSVVASEMRDLSERTGASAEEIALLIQAIQKEVENAQVAMRKGNDSVEGGLRLAGEAEKIFGTVLHSSQKATEMTLSIRRSTGEQARAAVQIMEATGRVKTMIENIARATAEQAKGVALIKQTAEEMRKLSGAVSKATSEQATSSGRIAETTELVSEKSRQISRALSEHRKSSESILRDIESVKEIPLENRKLAFRVSAELMNLQKEVELLGAEMERFRFSGKQTHSLRLGVVPLQAPSIMFRKFAPLSAYLSGQLGRKVDLRVSIDMESAVREIGENITQLCAMGPADYIYANSKYGVTVIAKALRKGKPFHRAAIVVSAGSGLQSVSELKGRSMAFTSENSATGHVIPLAVLREAGVMTNDLKSYKFLGNHTSVADGVLSGEFEAGAMMEETAERYKERGLKILGLSAEIPEFNICGNTSLDDATIKAIRNALVSLDSSRKDDLAVLTSMGKDCTGFMAATESDYAAFRTAIKGLGT
ncbi:MAG: hypothetical protein C0402_03865 [Thermodesulfovibrio sp.]|nr:hypothetical protein [Thermodesulfovibrio sp.]